MCLFQLCEIVVALENNAWLPPCSSPKAAIKSHLHPLDWCICPPPTTFLLPDEDFLTRAVIVNFYEATPPAQVQNEVRFY